MGIEKDHIKDGTLALDGVGCGELVNAKAADLPTQYRHDACNTGVNVLVIDKYSLDGAHGVYWIVFSYEDEAGEFRRLMMPPKKPGAVSNTADPTATIHI